MNVKEGKGSYATLSYSLLVKNHNIQTIYQANQSTNNANIYKILFKTKYLIYYFSKNN